MLLHSVLLFRIQKVSIWPMSSKIRKYGAIYLTPFLHRLAEEIDDPDSRAPEIEMQGELSCTMI